MEKRWRNPGDKREPPILTHGFGAHHFEKQRVKRDRRFARSVLTLVLNIK